MQVKFSVLSQGPGWKSLAVSSPNGKMPHARLVRRAKAREAAKADAAADNEPDAKRPKRDDESSDPNVEHPAGPKPVAARVKVYFSTRSEDGKKSVHAKCSYEVVDKEKLSPNTDMLMNVFQLMKNSLTGVYDK